MRRQTVIAVMTPNRVNPLDEIRQIEVWGNLKKVCKAKGWSYNTLTRKELPIIWKGNTIWRVVFQ